MITPLIQAQFAALQKDHADARIEVGPGGAIVSIPGMALEPSGSWSKPATTVRILAPPAFPQARPDCFWVDEDVRLASGGLPQSAQVNSQLGPNLLWFSWHVQKWNPNIDTLQTYVKVVQERLRQPV
jgi:Prokaryotic E2 family E